MRRGKEKAEQSGEPDRGEVIRELLAFAVAAKADCCKAVQITEHARLVSA